MFPNLSSQTLIYMQCLRVVVVETEKISPHGLLAHVNTQPRLCKQETATEHWSSQSGVRGIHACAQLLWLLSFFHAGGTELNQEGNGM